MHHPLPILLLALLLALASCTAPEAGSPPTEQLQLWPEASRSQATLTLYHPATIHQIPCPAVLICPGGGYTYLYMENEGHSVARWFAAQGYLGALLHYRLPGGQHHIPLEDAEQAMHLIRSQATAWHVDPQQVGIVGASAGGHLAASLSTLAAAANRPNFAILFYPVISFDPYITHYATREALLGADIADPSLLQRYSLEHQIDSLTPPTLLLLCSEDAIVNPENSHRYHAALAQRHIPVHLHQFPGDSHGWGLDPQFPQHATLATLLQDWLQTLP
jgi:acetyl esterase/lipase